MTTAIAGHNIEQNNVTSETYISKDYNNGQWETFINWLSDQNYNGINGKEVSKVFNKLRDKGFLNSKYIRYGEEGSAVIYVTRLELKEAKKLALVVSKLSPDEVHIYRSKEALFTISYEEKDGSDIGVLKDCTRFTGAPGCYEVRFWWD